MDQSRVRLSDVHESIAAINDYWSYRSQQAEVAALRDELQSARQELALLKTRKVVRAANLVSRLRHRQRPADRHPAAAAPTAGPLFSVMITVFNNGPHLHRALRSVRTQTLPDSGAPDLG